MVSGNPPSQAGKKDDPVTIDLEATRTNEPLALDDPESVAARDAVEGRPPADATIPAEPTGSVTPPPARDAEEPQQPVDEPSDRRINDDGAGQATPPHPHEEPPIEKRGGTSLTSLLAAGIAGGLIALVCYGAVDYAGLIPTHNKGETDAVDSLTAEVDGLKQTVATLSANAGKSAAALEPRIASLEKKAADSDALASKQDLGAVKNQVEQLAGTLTQLKQQQSNNASNLDQRLDAAEKKLNDPTRDQIVAQAVAAAALKSAIDRGGPFKTEIDAYRGVAPDNSAGKELAAFAAKGVPTQSELARRAPQVTSAIVSAIKAVPKDANWRQRLMASASSLVQVRPVGDVTGDDPEDIAARYQNKIENGDLDGAVSEWNKLPNTAKGASLQFEQDVEARIKVNNLVAQALDDAVSAEKQAKPEAAK